MFTIKIKTDNAAFEDKNAEIARILREIANDLEKDYVRSVILDHNGNNVGTVDVDAGDSHFPFVAGQTYKFKRYINGTRYGVAAMTGNFYVCDMTLLNSDRTPIMTIPVNSGAIEGVWAMDELV